ncbi:hypothetical protein [Pseudomonas mediterranea]|uniref:hypothetical protein n=1 Tax=Pseudomonas mediterranea TaxID=183795 RepID=UPI00191F2DD2|nr:hypothetical protein [Pseudomonas mediterranea]MBL0845115.1 hypothetical protein [Pseudomonas mediterranea]
MFDQLLALVNLGEKLPEAVGWQFIGPYTLSIPEEILEALDKEKIQTGSSYTSAALVIFNYSGASKSEIRVLYSGDFEFKPKITYGRRKAPVKWEHNTENNELIFHDIPPNEKVEIELFNVYQGFSIDQILVDGKLITEFMSKRALAKAYPSPLWLKALLVCASLIGAAAIAMAASTSYTVYKTSKDNELLYGVPSGYSGCTPYFFDNPPDDKTKEILTRKIKKLTPWMHILLAKNRVSSESELYDLDRIILCTPDTN